MMFILEVIVTAYIIVDEDHFSLQGLCSNLELYEDCCSKPNLAITASLRHNPAMIQKPDAIIIAAGVVGAAWSRFYLTGYYQGEIDYERG